MVIVKQYVKLYNLNVMLILNKQRRLIMRKLRKPKSNQKFFTRVSIYDGESCGGTCDNRVCAGGGNNCTNKTC